MISPARRVLSEKNVSSSLSMGSTTSLQRCDSASPTMSTASRSLRNLAPFASHSRMRTPSSSKVVSAMGSPSVGALKKGDDLCGRRRNEVTDMRVEIDFRLRQKFLCPTPRIRRVDQGILAAEEDRNRHLQPLQFVIACRGNRIAPRREIAKDQPEEILNRLWHRSALRVGASQHHGAHTLAAPFAQEEIGEGLEQKVFQLADSRRADEGE